MKIRRGFVSNSSSSSFVCDVCGDTQSGWDLCLEEADMSECPEGHVFCNSEMVDEESCEEKGYEISSDHCPICQLEVLTSKDEAEYLRLKLGIKDTKGVIAEIKATHKDYDGFKQFIKGKR